MKVFIMRGIPGSGKSTWIKNNHVENHDICSADSFHIREGKYQFDPKRAGKAHNKCLDDFLLNLQAFNLDQIFVDNTNTTAWEISPYYRLAEIHTADVEIITILCPIEVAIRRNVHNVPATTIMQMHRNILTEQLPPHWKHRIILAEGI